MSWQISCGFKNLDKLGVRIKKIKNTLLVGFFKNQSKSRLFEKKIQKDFPVKWTQIKYKGNSFIKFSTISIFWWTFFWSDYLISFFVSRYLTVSLRGPVLAHYDEADRLTCDGFWVRKRTFEKNGHPSIVILHECFPRNVLFDGLDGRWPKVSFNFFHIKIY